MKLVILRGLPGCGKSTIAEKLSKKLNCRVIHGDVFKLEFLKKNNDFKKAREYSQTRILEEIKKYFRQKEKLIIAEELFYSKELIKKIKNFYEENRIDIIWFYIKRDLEKLLEVENKRNRKVKNTIEDFRKLQKNLKEINNKREVIVDNNGSIEDSVSFILNRLTK